MLKNELHLTTNIRGSRMYKEIYWHAFFKVATKDSAQKLLKKFDECCETKATLLTCERYWKDDSLFNVTFTTPLMETDVSSAVFTVLLTTHKLANAWNVTGPYSHERGMWEFHGLATKTKVPGIEWIEFRMEKTVGFGENAFCR